MGTRKANILYKLRKKGVVCNTRERTIDIPYNGKPFEFVQAERLVKEFHFVIQLTII